eukprot:3817450-Pleurochrysis_carterae.AAC.2
MRLRQRLPRLPQLRRLPPQLPPQHDGLALGARRQRRRRARRARRARLNAVLTAGANGDMCAATAEVRQLCT